MFKEDIYHSCTRLCNTGSERTPKCEEGGEALHGVEWIGGKNIDLVAGAERNSSSKQKQAQVKTEALRDSFLAKFVVLNSTLASLLLLDQKQFVRGKKIRVLFLFSLLEWGSHMHVPPRSCRRPTMTAD